MLNVFLTVDTEFWPRVPEINDHAVRLAMRRDIYGETEQGDFGLPHQLRVLDEFGLRGVFLVEALSASAVGLDYLREIVDVIRNAGQEVQLHLHPEWLRRIGGGSLPVFRGPGMKDYTRSEQSVLVGRALENLAAAGVEGVRGFRAGGYGANLDTLGALGDHGIAFDTSYNYPWLGVTCDIRLPLPLVQPVSIGNVVEVPVSHFQDYPGHARHAEICACSSGEMERALDRAWQQGWRSFVIVSHSFELVQRRAELERPPIPNKVAIGRMRRLCAYLAAHPDRFRTAGFADLSPADVIPAHQPEGLRGSVLGTARRMAEQLAGRFL